MSDFFFFGGGEGRGRLEYPSQDFLSFPGLDVFKLKEKFF